MCEKKLKDNFFVFEGKQQYLFYVMNYMCCVVFIDYKIKPGGVQWYYLVVCL